MTPSTKKISILVLVIALLVIGVIGWSIHSSGTPSGELSSTIPSAPASSTAVQASSTGGSISVSITPTPASSSTANSTVWQPFSNKAVGISFDYPPGWSIGPNVPISLDDFNHHYQGDSIIPAGGAEIDIVSTKYYGSLADLIKTDTLGDTVSATSSVMVDQVPCAEVLYGSRYAAGYPSSNGAVYCESGNDNVLYKIYLSYPAQDVKTTQNLATFSTFLKTVKFTQ